MNWTQTKNESLGALAYASPLIAGDGVDLVVHPRNGRSRTVQIDLAHARALAAQLIEAADASEMDRDAA